MAPPRPRAAALARPATAIAALVTGVSAGFFYAYADSVTRGLARVGDPSYVQAFQSINEVVRTPLFMVIFAGPLGLLAVSLAASRHHRVARLLLVAGLVAYAGVVVVTMTGNVPLNEQLATVTAADAAGLAAARAAFEGPWNALNLLRTLLAVTAFGCTVAALGVDPPRTPRAGDRRTIDRPC